LRFTLSGVILGTIALFLFSTTNIATPYSAAQLARRLRMGPGAPQTRAPEEPLSEPMV
jgi:hypothetical protein